MQRPEPSEYHAFYSTYVDKVPDGDIFEILESGLQETVDLFGRFSGDRETFAYEPGKWTVRELLGHMTDAERLFGFRALWMARGDQQSQPGMDQNDWAAASNAGQRPLAEQLAEFDLARRSNLAMLRGFDAADWGKTGTASDCMFTVRAFPFILAGHEIHHQLIVSERYLNA